MKAIVIKRGFTAELDALPPYSIALDGYVQGPAVDTAHKRYSFDHHASCVRHSTAATCQQVFDALALGLNPEPFTAYVNDIDGDTVLSVWLLMYPGLATTNPTIWELVEVVGKIDAHGPASAKGVTMKLRRMTGGRFVRNQIRMNPELFRAEQDRDMAQVTLGQPAKVRVVVPVKQLPNGNRLVWSTMVDRKLAKMADSVVVVR